MITKETKLDVQFQGELKTKAFEVKTDDAKLFHILSNLYSNPLGAVVREYSTNCLDGHKLSGNEDKPFDIILPGKLDYGNFIIFRDYGPGMSNETVETIFTKYGESTKTNSDSFTGCLGLGSKSALAITDSFTVTSINNGIKTVYSVSKDNAGKPTLITFDTGETSDPNGLIIEIPLDEQYKSVVLHEIQSQLMYFKVKPRIFKDDKILDDIFELNIWERGVKLNDTFTLKKDYKKIVMGEIGYLFNIYNFLNALTVSDKIADFQIDENLLVNQKMYDLLSKFLNNINFDIYVDMGDITFAPSREEIIYDTFTVLKLTKYLYNFISILNNILVKKMKSTKNIFDLYLYATRWQDMLIDKLYEGDIELRYIHSYYIDYLFDNILDTKTLFEIENLAELMNFEKLHYFQGSKYIKNFNSFHNDTWGQFISQYHFKKIEIYDKQIKKYIDIRSATTFNDIQKSLSENCKIILVPYKSQNTKWFKSLVKDKKIDARLYVIQLEPTSYEKKDEEKIIELVKQDILEYTKLSEDVFLDHHKLLEEFKEIQSTISKEKREGIKLFKSTLANIQCKSIGTDKLYTKDEISELEGIFIPTIRYKYELPYNFNFLQNPIKLKDFISAFKEYFPNLDTPIYYGNEKYFRNSKLVNFNNILDKAVEDIKKANIKIKMYSDIHYYDEYLFYLTVLDLDSKVFKKMEYGYFKEIAIPKKEQEERTKLKEKVKPFREWFEKDFGTYKLYDLLNNIDDETYKFMVKTSNRKIFNKLHENNLKEVLNIELSVLKICDILGNYFDENKYSLLKWITNFPKLSEKNIDRLFRAIQKCNYDNYVMNLEYSEFENGKIEGKEDIEEDNEG